MKNNFRFVSIVFLTAIYCFAIGVVTKKLTYSDFYDNSATSQEKIFSDTSTIFFCHTNQSESLVNNYNNLFSLNFKNSFSSIWVISKITEKIFETAFSQYTNISRNFLIQHRKTDIIFPFHYFW